MLPASCPPALLPAMPSKLKPLRIAVAMVLAMWIIALAGRGAHAADTPSFRNEVMAVLSKAGCNLGTCHGNKNGKGGLLLSLRGEWPDTDYRTLTREVHSRRIDRLQPEQSLLLKKPTMQLAHEGGRRLRVGDAQYEILRRWIAAGAPDDGDTAPTPTALEVSPLRQVAYAPADEVQLTVHAVFSDGSRRDVAALAVYEPVDEDMVEVSPSGLVRRAATGETVILVRYLHLQVPVTVAFVDNRSQVADALPPVRNEIDRHIFAKLAELRLPAAEICSDSEFVRRIYLDVLGKLPTADEARAFVTDTEPGKRDRLIEQLLVRPEYAQNWALKWSDLLRNEEKVLDRKGVQNFHGWIRRSFAEGKPLDQFARELIAARGSTYTQPEANWYRANRDPITRAESTAQVFLGVRLQCAKCHSHPFDRWTQDDYYNWAAVFARVDYKVLENNRRDRNDKHEFDGEQIVWMPSKGEVTNARTGEQATPQFLGGEILADPEGDRLLALAEWMTDGNRRFALVQANRIWAQLLGRGLVEPVDDFRATNPASHPELLEYLADELVSSGYDVRHLIRTILQSSTYQLSSRVADPASAADERNFTHAIEQRLPAEQLLDAICQVADAPARFNGYPRGIRAVEIPGVQAVRSRDARPTPAEQFLTVFGKPPRLLTCECERTHESTLSQTFQLVSGPLMNELLTRDDGRLSRLLAEGVSPVEAVDELFWAALSRAPSDAERSQLTAYLADATDRRQALEDIAWGLMNSREFLFRR